MLTRVLSAGSDDDVRVAGEMLRGGYLVAFATETVYGLGVRADDAAAVRALCVLKQRPAEKKFTVLIPDSEECDRYAAPLCAAAAALAAAFWPGPLTLVVPDGRGGHVGLRCPDCESTRAMLRGADVPVVAPSANVSGRSPATTAAEVLAVFEGRIAAVLDAGPARIGAPSTVVRVTREQATILRAGVLSEALIRATLGG